MRRILVAAGGTGGHIIPGLVVAKQLHARGVKVHWVGSSRGLEKKLVAPEFPISYLRMKALRGKGFLGYLLLPLRLLRAVGQSIAIVVRFKPEVVLTMGSFVSAPVGLAAWLLRIPVVVHEQNAIAGMANKWLSKLAFQSLQAFPDAFLKNKAILTVGNPVNAALIDMISPKERYARCHKKMRILVLGGSQGAKRINDVVSQWVLQYALADEVELRHQTGVAQFSEISNRYKQSDVVVDVVEFIDDMVDAYRWADLVLCRAGAMTVSEVAAAGLAAIFIPFPFAVDNHQYFNAQYLVKAGAADIINQSDFSVEIMNQSINQYLQDRQALLELACNAHEAAFLDATNKITSALGEVYSERYLKKGKLC